VLWRGLSWLGRCACARVLTERISRQPWNTVLHRAVCKGAPAFLASAAAQEREVPRFVERELTGYLRCGRPEYGFAKVRCQACEHITVVAFSCKGRGVCPSCAGRRMADVACHLLDRVLPEVPYRQWVLSFPPPIRYLLAYDAALLSKALQSFVGAVSHWQRHQAKKRYGLRSVRDAVGGAVTVVQRFGSALNLNVHFHSLWPDGVWEQREDNLVFRVLGQPTEDELRDIGWRACQSLLKHLRAAGRWVDEDFHVIDDLDALSEQQPLLAEVYGASIRGRLAMGPSRGQRVMVLRRGPDLRAPAQLHAAQPIGFSFDVHAAVAEE
jgi:ribosomal protein S27E